jgi:hypothetical protein
MSTAAPAADDEELNHLQRLLLTAVLQREPLPGGRHPVELPDLALMQKGGTVRVSTDHAVGSLASLEASLPIEMRSPDSLQNEACAHGDVTYLAFEPVERVDDRVRLTLAGHIATCAPERRPLGLSGLQVEFRRVGDHWEVVNPPAAFAV